MSVSATSPVTQQAYDQPFDRLVPTLPSENAATAFPDGGKGGKHVGMFAGDEPSFKDLFDVINPLQHIPVVDSIYRELTGEKIGVGPRLLGGALYGGPIGLIAAAIQSVTEEATGNDIGGNVIALLKGDSSDSPPDNGPVLAEANTGNGDAAKDESAAQSVVIPDLLGGDEAPAPAKLAAASPLAPAPAAATPVSAQAIDDPAPAAGDKPGVPRPMPLLNREPRFMPVPNRGAPSVKPLAPAGLPISNNNARTNVPVTGRPVAANGAVNPFLSQQVMAQEMQAGKAPANSAPPQEWFQSAVMQAMDKYERSAKLGQKASAGEAVSEPQ